MLAATREPSGSPAVALHNSSAVTVQRSAIAIGLSGVLIGVLGRENFLVAQIGMGRALSRQVDSAGDLASVAVAHGGFGQQDNVFDVCCAPESISMG